MVSTGSTTVSLKLIIDSTGEKVLFAEAGKDFIDFLFSLLSLPIGIVVKLQSKPDKVGCLGNLYESIDNLDEAYLQPNQNKDILLNPRASFSDSDVSLMMPATKTPKLYICPNYCRYRVTHDKNNKCPLCNCSMGYQVEVAGEAVSGVFVKGAVNYMIMDDFVVEPVTSFSSFITLLRKFNVKDIGTLKEKVIDLGLDEALKLLKASLSCKTVLTSVFLND